MSESSRKSLRDRVRTRDLRVFDRGPLAYTVSSALHYGLRVVMKHKVVRDQDQIHDEYQLTKRFDWREGLSVDDLILSDDHAKKWILRDDKLELGTERTVRAYLLARLESRIRELLPDGRGRVVEFGCGTGRNLFYLARKFPQLELVGLELTPSTVEYAQGISDREGFGVTFHVADMTADLSGLGRADVVFSVHALEQLPDAFPRAFDNMAAMSRRAVVLFEPVHELFPWSLRGIAARFRIKTANYLDGLFRYVKSKPDVVVEHAQALPYGTPLNQTVEVVTTVRPRA